MLSNTRSIRTAAYRLVAASRFQRRLPTDAAATSSRLLSFPSPVSNNLILPSVRFFAAMSDNDLKKRLDDFQDLFVEARLCIEDVQDSAGTKYFDEEAEAAQEAVDDAVKAFEKIISDIEDADEKNRVLRGNGLKVEQLKGELEMAVKGGHDH